MMALFAGHMGAHGTHGIPELKGIKYEIKSTARTPREPVTLELWEQHLAGKRPLGIIPIREDSNCVWGSIDIDDYINDLFRIIDTIEKNQIPLISGRSKSGGLHLFMFLKEPVPAGVLQTALKNLAAHLGVANSEIFPKQSQVLTDRGDVGNWIIMPYFGDTYGGKLKEQVGLRKTGAELTVEQFLELAERAKVDPEELQEWLSMAPKKPNGKEPSGLTPGEAFSDGPPCLQIMAKEGVAFGGQNTTLLNMGSYYKKKNPVDWKIDLEKANRTYLTPPGSAEGLVSVMKSLDKTDYEYTCKTAPLCDHCNSSVCRTRKFGVGGANNYPQITSFSKLDIEPPLWFVDIDDKRVEITTDEILYYNRFLKVCFEQQKVYDIMSQGAWLAILRPLMENCMVLDCPPEVSKGGHFKELLEEFCTNRQKGRAREDLLLGRPWENEEEGRHYFRLKDFQKYLTREGIKDYTRGQITQRIKHLKGNSSFFNIKGHGINVWWVPSQEFVGVVEASLPVIGRSVI